MYYIQTDNKDVESIVWILVFVLIITYATFAFVMLPMWYRSLCYYVSPEEITILSGVLVKKRINIRTTAIQYTTVVRCPIFLNVNINILLINVYGRRVILMFLNLHDMEEINKIIHFQLKGKRN